MDLRVLALVASISHGIAAYCTCPASDPYCKREFLGSDTYCYTSSRYAWGKECNGGECTHDYGTEMCVDKPAHFDKAAAGTTSVSGERCMLNHGASLCECGGAQDSAICERCEGSACQCQAPDSPDCGAWVDFWYSGLCNGNEEPNCKGLTASAAALSSTAYTGDDNHIWGEPRLGFPGLADWIHVDDFETEVRVTTYVNEPLGILGIGFRGTDSIDEGLIDLDYELTDCNVFQSSSCGQVHGGFQDAFLDSAFKLMLNTHIDFALNDAQGRPRFALQKVLVTGHSLGGALATIGAYYLAKQNPEWGSMMQVVTFGSPRVGDAAFVDAYRLVVPFTIAYAGRCSFSATSAGIGTVVGGLVLGPIAGAGIGVVTGGVATAGWDRITAIPLEKQGFEHVYATWETADDHNVDDAAICHSMGDIYIPHVMKKMQGAIASSSCASVDLGTWTFPSLPPASPPAPPMAPVPPCTCPSDASECIYSNLWGGNYCYTSSLDITGGFCNGGECTASSTALCTCPPSAHECLYSDFWEGNYCYTSSSNITSNYCNGGQCTASGIAPLASPSPPSLPPPLPPPPLPPFPPSPPPCVDTDGNATDSYGDGCALYITSWCGGFDDEDFSSSGMCCICGGGFAPPSLPPSPSPPSSPPAAPCSDYLSVIPGSQGIAECGASGCSCTDVASDFLGFGNISAYCFDEYYGEAIRTYCPSTCLVCLPVAPPPSSPPPSASPSSPPPSASPSPPPPSTSPSSPPPSASPSSPPPSASPSSPPPSASPSPPPPSTSPSSPLPSASPSSPPPSASPSSPPPSTSPSSPPPSASPSSPPPSASPSSPPPSASPSSPPPSTSPSSPPPSASPSSPPPSASPSSPPPSASPSSPPPSASPSPPPAVSPPQSGGSFRVVASFTASGEVGDFDEATKRNILSKLAQLAGFASAPLGSTLEVTAGSVIIVAKFPVVTQSEASAAQSSLTQSSVAAGQDSFEAQIGPILATVGASINDAVVVEVEEDPKPTASSGSPVVAIAVAAAGVAAVAALGGGVYYKKKRRAHAPSNSAMTKIEHGSKPEPVNDADATSLA